MCERLQYMMDGRGCDVDILTNLTLPAGKLLARSIVSMILMATHRVIWVLEQDPIFRSFPTDVWAAARRAGIRSPLVVAVPLHTSPDKPRPEVITAEMAMLTPLPPPGYTMGVLGQVVNAARASSKIIDIIGTFEDTDELVWFVKQASRRSVGPTEVTVLTPFVYNVRMAPIIGVGAFDVERMVKIAGVVSYRTNQLVPRWSKTLPRWRTPASPAFGLEWLQPSVFIVYGVACGTDVFPPPLDNTVAEETCRRLLAGSTGERGGHAPASSPDARVPPTPDL